MITATKDFCLSVARNNWLNVIYATLFRSIHKSKSLRKNQERVWYAKKLSILIISIFVQASVYAGGLWMYETGTPGTGLANAGLTARAQDASTAYNNPAGMSLLERSEVMVGLQALYGDLDFYPDGLTDVSGGSGGNSIGWVPGGSFAYVHKLNEKWSFGISNFSNFGLGLDYDDNWVGRYYVQEATLVGMSVMPSVSYRIDEQWSVGIGLNAMYGILDNKVAINNITDGWPDGQMKYKDTTWGFGYVPGLIYELDKKTRFGLTYTSPVDLDFEDRPEFTNLGPGLNWLINRADVRSLDLSMTVPQTVMGSFYHELNDKWNLLGNLGWQDWSEFGKVDVAVDAANDHSVTTDLNYKDTWTIGLGTQYKFAPRWMATTGISYDSSMLDDEDRTPTMPVGETWRWGLGLQHDLSDATTIGVQYELAYSGDLEMDYERGLLSGRVAGEYQDVFIHMFSVSMVHRF